MSTRRHWVLAIVLALLAVYFALFEGFSDRRPVPDSETGEKLFACARAQPRQISVSTARGRLDGKRSDGRWETSVGGLAPAAFESLADSLCRLPVIERIPGETMLADFGLEPPAAELHVVSDAGDSRLLLGAQTPASNLMYAKFADQPDVLKIGAELASNVERVARYAAQGAGA
jgi:hypothetical protein